MDQVRIMPSSEEMNGKTRNVSIVVRYMQISDKIIYLPMIEDTRRSVG
jgi:hypothetical protein